MKYIILILSILSAHAHAAGYTTPDNQAVVSWLNVEPSLVRVAYSHPNKQNPDGCGTSSEVILTNETQWGQMQYSTILAAMMAGKRVRFYVSGCQAGWGTTYPKIQSVYVFN